MYTGILEINALLCKLDILTSIDTAIIINEWKCWRGTSQKSNSGRWCCVFEFARARTNSNFLRFPIVSKTLSLLLYDCKKRKSTILRCTLKQNFLINASVINKELMTNRWMVFPRANSDLRFRFFSINFWLTNRFVKVKIFSWIKLCVMKISS